jgi:hypothetical protein
VPPSRRVRGAAIRPVSPSSTAPDAWVQNRADPGRTVGTIASNGFGTAKWAVPVMVSSAARFPDLLMFLTSGRATW